MPRIIASARSTSLSVSGFALPTRRSRRPRVTALTPLQIAALSLSMPSTGETLGRRDDGARELDNGTTTSSSSSTPVEISSTETMIAGRFLPGSPFRAAPSETVRSRRAGAQAMPSPRAASHSRSSACATGSPASAREASRSDWRIDSRSASRASSSSIEASDTPRSRACSASRSRVSRVTRIVAVSVAMMAKA